MANLSDRKLYLGPKLRVLRRELGLNQTQMAEELGVSPSYLNHLERNQRPFTALAGRLRRVDRGSGRRVRSRPAVLPPGIGGRPHG